MSLSRLFGLLALTLAAQSCDFFPTEEEIVDELERSTERKARSAAGHWIGVSPALTLDFQLQEGDGSAVSGSGTMKEAAATGSLPISVTGSYERPQLSLTFDGLVFEGHTVQGTFQGSYTSFVGITAPLRLTAQGYSRDIEVLLQEPE